jgi:hypothetical protein
MPNFSGRRAGLVTRIGRGAFAGPEKIFGLASRGVHVEALEIAYDPERWLERFLASWPEGSSAHASYFRRLVEGPRFAPLQAHPRAA